MPRPASDSLAPGRSLMRPLKAAAGRPRKLGWLSEHTLFLSIDPGLRKPYLGTIQKLLKASAGASACCSPDREGPALCMIPQNGAKAPGWFRLKTIWEPPKDPWPRP